MTSFLTILDTTLYKTSNKVPFILVDYQLNFLLKIYFKTLDLIYTFLNVK